MVNSNNHKDKNKIISPIIIQNNKIINASPTHFNTSAIISPNPSVIIDEDGFQKPKNSVKRHRLDSPIATSSHRQAIN